MHIGKFLRAPLDTGKHSRSGVHHRLRLALALVEQLLFVRFKSFVNFFALGDYISEKFFAVGKLAFQFLQLHQQACHLFIACLGCGSQTHGIGDALGQQFKLRAELRHRLRRPKTFLFVARLGFALIQLGVHRRYAVDNASMDRRVAHSERGQ